MPAARDSQPRQPQRLQSLKNPRPRVPFSPRQQQHQQQVDRPSVAPPARRCPNPDCDEPDPFEDNGNVICRTCSTVISDANIVSELQFAETSSGGHLMVGQHVGADQAFARGSLAGLRNAGARSSREITESEGRRHINQIGAALRIASKLTESGLRTFNLAASHNFVQGRSIKSVAAVSLYIACRSLKENTHMLIDFSDILQLNVFRLGQIYRDLVRELELNGFGQKIEPLNPESLVERFADRLEFGNDRMAVANDGVRIVQRMRRDWMVTGRRPAGLCGAALIIAAKMHNYRRTPREMTFVAKVSEPTLMKRLEEFARTESSGLTIDEFRKINLERYSDPPAFYEKNSKGRRTRKRRCEEMDYDDSDVESPAATPGAQPSSSNLQSGSPAAARQQTERERQSMPPPPVPIDPALTAGEPPRKRRRGRPPKAEIRAQQGPLPSSPPPSQKRGLGPDITSALTMPTRSTSADFAHASALTQLLDQEGGLASPPATQEHAPNKANRPILMTEDISDSEFGPDPEILNCHLTAEEVEIKTRIWTHENRDWIRAQNAKRLKKQLAEENGTAPTIKRRIRRRTRMGDMRVYRRESAGDANGDEGNMTGDEDSMPARSALEATRKMLEKRSYSRKINYEALNKLYAPSPKRSSTSGSTSDSRRESVSGTSVVVQSPGAGNLFESSTVAGAVEVTTPGGTTRPESAVPVPLDDIQEVALEGEQQPRQEEKEKRGTTAPPGPTRNPEAIDEEDDDDHPDYYIDEDDEARNAGEDGNESPNDIEDILKEAGERESDEGSGGEDEYL